jgi:hypothetical protein
MRFAMIIKNNGKAGACFRIVNEFTMYCAEFSHTEITIVLI